MISQASRISVQPMLWRITDRTKDSSHLYGIASNNRVIIMALYMLAIYIEKEVPMTNQ